MKNQSSVGDLLGDQHVVPVVVIDNAEQAHGLTRALLDGGVKVIEITLRNAYGVQAIALIKENYPDMIVLAGTVNSVSQLMAVVRAGVDGIISPGITAKLAEAAQAQGVPYLPGVATASEVLLAMQFGLRECKLFPATVVGGIAALKAFKGPFPGMLFCPTGGVNANNYRDFLALPNVMCVGGSWLAPQEMIEQARWNEITDLCKAVTTPT